MTQPYGIDASVLVRLIIGDPEPDFEHCVIENRVMIEVQNAEAIAFRQVLDETCIVLQRYYGISATDARSALAGLLNNGLVTTLNEHSVTLALRATGEPGVLERLTADKYPRGPGDAYPQQTNDNAYQNEPAVSRVQPDSRNSALDLTLE